MTTVPHPRTKVRCPAVAAVSAATLSTLTAPPADLRAVGGPLACELVAGHDGTHIALAGTARGGDQWWWLRWQEPPGEVMQIDPCAAELPHGSYSDCCTLPDDHTGPHSFDLPPLSPWPGQTTPWPRAGRDSPVDSAQGGWLVRLHNPGNHACACLPECWCKQTRIGGALRWYTPGRWHRLPDPSSRHGLQTCR